MRGQLLRALAPLRLGNAGNQGSQSMLASLSGRNPAFGLSSLNDESEKSDKSAPMSPFMMNQILARHLTTSSTPGVPPPGTNPGSPETKVHEVNPIKALADAAAKRPSLMMTKAKTMQNAMQKQMLASYATAAHADDHPHDMRVNTHPFHVLPWSWWPALSGCSTFTFFLGCTMWLNHYPGGDAILALGVLNATLTAMNWWRDICIESQMGMHNDYVRNGLTQGMYWFICSEAFLFVGLLWACVHVGIAPNVGIHMQWPPVGVHAVDWDKRALVMSVVLAASYFSANLAMYSKPALWGTIGLGALFLASQYVEYTTAPFTISDSAYGSTFYMTTGFHGLHVLLGSIYLAVCALMKPTTYGPSIGLRNAILYWHFVDIVWIGVYGIIYVGGF